MAKGAPANRTGQVRSAASWSAWWVHNVIAQASSDSTTSGNFSTISRAGVCRAAGAAPRQIGGAAEPTQRPIIQNQQQRRYGHQRRLGHQSQAEHQRHEQIPPDARTSLGIAPVGCQGEHEEQSAEHVSPFGDPGHVLDVLRMNGKDRGHGRTGPELAGHAAQHEKQPDRRGGMQQQVGQVVAPGGRAIKLPIEHVRKHRGRIPLAERPAGQRPGDAVGRQAFANGGALVDIGVVVVVEKGKRERLTINDRDRQEQQAGNCPGARLPPAKGGRF